MIAWLIAQKWRLLQYPAEILINALIIWWLLNRLAPPRMVIEDAPEDGGKAVLRRVANFPFWRCLACSGLLFGAALFAAVPMLLSTWYGFRHGPDVVVFFALWFFVSRWAVSLVFEGSRAQHLTIFIFYIAVSLGVEWAIGLVA